MKMKFGNHRFHDGVGGTAFVVRVVPKSSKNEIAELMGDGSVRIHLKAPPIEGRANRQLIEFLSEIFHINTSHIKIAAGERSKIKIVTVEGLLPTEVEEILSNHLNRV